MKVSKLFFLFILTGLFSVGLFFDSANAQVDNYFEENTVCGTTTTSTIPIQITDSTEFEFQDGRDYLIVVTSTFAGDNAKTYEINLKHGTTIFEGSQMIVEPKDSGVSCAVSTRTYKYFFSTIWSPVGVGQASESITLNYISLDATTAMVFDDVTIFVMDMNQLTENTDWFFDENTIDTTLASNGTGFNTTNSAILSFTPTTNNDDWLIFGNALLTADDVATQYQTRLNFGNETFTPIISKEGEDIAEQILQTFSRVFTLNNTQSHTFKIESNNDGIPVGVNERIYNSIFALNLDKFQFHNSTYIDGGIIPVQEPEYNTNFVTLNTNITSSDTEWFIFGGFTKDDSKNMELRLQVDDVDEPTGQTTQSYDFSDGWDSDDRVPNNFMTVENLTSSTVHTIDIDGSMAGAGAINARHRSMFAFSLQVGAVIFEDPLSWTDSVVTIVDMGKSFDDPVSMTDFINITTTKVKDDPMSMVDDIRLDITNTDDDPMSWTDSVNIVMALEFDDPVSMTDDIRLDITNTDDDAMSWIDSIIVIKIIFQDDPMSMIDDIRLDITNTDDDPMSFTDSIIAKKTISKNDPMSILDSASFTVTLAPIIIQPTGGGGGVGTVPTVPDSDGDGILDPDDACPLEKEIFNGFQDTDGCPDSILEPALPIEAIDFGFPFEFNELDVFDDFIDLDTITPQPQIETLKFRWLGDEPITITSVMVADSPFEFQFENIPITFGSNQFGFTQAQITYTVQEPAKICGNILALDCFGDVTYEIPVFVTGEIGFATRTVVASGSITVDNSDRLNPFLLVLPFLILIPLIAFFLWRRKKKRNPNSKEKLQARSKPLKSGTTKKLLNEPKSNVLGRKTK